MYDVIITAAGTGSRTNLAYNKIFVELNGKPCILYSIEAFLRVPEVANIYLALQPSDELRMKELLEEYDLDKRAIFLVYGGKTRQESVYNVLQLVHSENVFIHDGARPFVPVEYFPQLKKALNFDKAAILATPVADTLKEITATKEINRTIPREKIAYAQTPQVFDTELIRKCHEQAKVEAFEATDDAQLVEVFGGNEQVQIVWGNKMNFKITTEEDIYLANLIASNE